METQICKKCNNNLPLSSFYKAKELRNGVKTQCKACAEDAKRTPEGLVIRALARQTRSSKNRGYTAPAYSKYELYSWLIAQPNFKDIFNAWVAANYITDLKPSIDRINDYKSYTLDNIQLVTAKQNKDRGHIDRVIGNNTKVNHAIDMLDLDGNFIKRFHSVAEAARSFINGSPPNIHIICKGTLQNGYKREIAYGHKWRYSKQPNQNTEII